MLSEYSPPSRAGTLTSPALAGIFFTTAPAGKPLFPINDAAAAKSLQSCPTLCDPIDGGPPGSPVPGILQARTLEWVFHFLVLQMRGAKMWVKLFKFTKMLLGDMPVRENGEGWEDCHSITQV